MKQLIYIGGGEVFRNEDDYCDALQNNWTYDPFGEQKNRKNWIANKLKDEYQVFLPDMPNRFNAKYKFWKIRFEKIFPYLNDDSLIMIGRSLGGIFLAKYLSENTFSLSGGKKISQLHLVAACFDEKDMSYLGDFLFDPTNLKRLEQQVEKIFLYHSKDDPIVPFSHVEKFKKYLPDAVLNVFENRGHFSQAEFSELLESIKK
ncbi:MAG: hypothetical protein NTY80_04830 [candidate division SR1 bacterium]|nr:hypothetical protein [candidate division SR1 bacterium]